MPQAPAVLTPFTEATVPNTPWWCSSSWRALAIATFVASTVVSVTVPLANTVTPTHTLANDAPVMPFSTKVVRR